MKTYPIFLASSFELQPEREKFEIFIGRQNKRLVKKNVMLELEVWEDMGAELNESRKQDDYNKILEKAEIVVVLFWTKMGKYTQDEFELAYKRFLDSENRRPLVYVYEKTTPVPNEPEENKKEFINRLQTEGKEQFHSTFDNYSQFENHFHQTLLDLFEKNELTFGKMAIRHSLKAPFPPSLVIGRDRELETISEKFKNKAQVILLNAEGGMGKTTLASKYWHENRYTYSHCAYLFCEGGILKAMMDDGLGLDLQGLDDPEKIRQLQRKLSGLADDFLLFLDNANEGEDIREFFNVFTGYNWNVLITSRCRDVFPNKADEICLAHPDPEDAKALFRNFYSEDSEEFEDLLDSLLKGIRYHTLLTELFAKNLKEASEMGTDLKSFLKKLEEKGLVLDSEDNFEVNTGWDDSVQKYAATVNDILEILYDFTKLFEEERYLLVNLALLPSDSYDLKFLLDLIVPNDRREYRDILKGLFKRGWVGGSDQQYRLSPVIQQLVLFKNKETIWEDGKDYFEKLADLIKYEDEKDNAHTKFKWIPFGRHLAKVFKDIEKVDFNSFFKLYYPKSVKGEEKKVLALMIKWNPLGKHLVKFYKNKEEMKFSLFLNNLCILLLETGGKQNLLEANELLEKALSMDIKNFGEDSTIVATRRSNLAIVLGDLGGKENLEEAKGQLDKALVSDIRNLGEDSPVVATRRSNLAMVLGYIGGKENLGEAKRQVEMALSSDIRNFGEDSPEVAIRRSNLAMVLRELEGKKNLEAARELLEKALVMNIRNFGEDSPAVATRRSYLAMVLGDLGGKKNLVEAKGQLEMALSSDIRNFGEDSPAVASRRSTLALVLRDLGANANLVEAKEQVEMALSSDIRNFGEDSPAVATRRSNLALVLQDIGGKKNLVEAKCQLEKALATDIRNFGEDSPDAATIRSNLALVLQDLGDNENLVEAKCQLEKALASGIRNFGEDSPAVATIRSNLARVLQDLEGEVNLLEAKEQLKKALASGILNFGEDSPNAALFSYNIGSVLTEIEGKVNLQEAKLHLEIAKKIYLKHFGDEYQTVKDIQSWIDAVDKKLKGISDK